ncbi:unnamed protein product [marine sediment metagenome]|uniref:Uncharacterized protein n=1 Tax=marine sediment metagenome TaxID=412755 RepID=X1LT15_9ZZZZ
MDDTKSLSWLGLIAGVLWYFYKKKRAPLAGPEGGYRLPIGWAKKPKKTEPSDVEQAVVAARPAHLLTPEEVTVAAGFERMPAGGWVI